MTTAATPGMAWAEREPFVVGRRVGDLQALVYSLDDGETWDVNVDRAGHLIAHDEGFPTKNEAVAHAQAVLDEARA